MFRTLIWMLYFCWYLIYSLRLRPKVARLERKGMLAERDELAHKEAMRWGFKVINFAKIKVTVIGEENIPKDKGVLFVGNHQSNLDIPIIMGFINKPKGFIAKVELAKIPILSKWMKYLGCVFIDRSDVRQSLLAINQGAENLKKGISMVIFPEGTRSKDGILGDFKPGSLKLAIKAGAPVIPVTLNGSVNILPKKGFIIRPTEVKIIISPPVVLEKALQKDSNALAEAVRNIIQENLKNY